MRAFDVGTVGTAIASVFVAVVFTCIYFFPTYVALRRGVTKWPLIAAINVFLGWTFIGWVVAFFMSRQMESAKELAILRGERPPDKTRAKVAGPGTHGDEEFDAGKYYDPRTGEARSRWWGGGTGVGGI